MHIPPQARDIPSDGFLSDLSEYNPLHRQTILDAIASAFSPSESVLESDADPIQVVDFDVSGATYLIAYRRTVGDERVLLSFFSYGRSPF